ncbi:K02A2.6-like, partial [Cordylochernes scorpioides]
MASYQFKEYNEETETFETFYERLEQFLILEEAGDEKKKAYLLTLMGSKTYSVLKNLCSPILPKDKTFDNLIDILKRHFSPKRSIVVERFIFFKRMQLKEESISDYLVEIKRLASSCNFGNFLEDSLRDKMVCGLYNAKIQNRIWSEGDISLAKVIEIALSMEAAEKNTKLFHLEQGEDCVDKLRMERKVESNFQNGKCKHCGKQHKELCRFKEAICFKCNKKGHIASICWSSRRNLRQHQNQPGNIHQIGDQEEEEEYVQKIISVTIPEYKINFASSDPPYLMELKVEGNFIKFEMDTGSGLTLISEKDFKNSLQHLKLEKASIIVRTYDGTVVPILGKINVKVECQDITYKLRALVVKGEKRALMGREWINRLKLGCFAVKHMPVEITIEEILKENQALFVETTEPIKGFTFSVNMCDVNPIFHKARPVPFAIRPAVTEALDKMVAKGYLCEVASSKWATPVVVVPKKNKEIRICCDFKVTLNKYLDTAAYPLPTQQDLFSTLAKGKYFSKLDLRNAYLQLEVDPGTRPLLTINTHKGLFRFKRMPFGLANAPSYFQSVMDRVLSGIGGVICYIDDVLIATASIEEHLALLKTIFARLAKYNIKLKKEKCLFLQKEIEYLGHLVTEEGIRPLDHKVQAIQKAKTPTNISELRSFLGLVNFYGKFIPNLPELLKPLHELLHKKRPWVWTKECGEAIDKCKNSITSERVLVPYDATLPLCLATDASQIGVGAVLSHIIEGQERPIMFASRTLSVAERNYSQIEKEALAIIYGVTKFHQFIYGRKFILITDHKPLVTILGSRSGIPTLSTSRLQRWALILSAYTYDIKFRRTQDHGNADLLSRFPVGCEEIPRLNNVYALSYVEELPITAEEIATETEKDEVLSLAKFYTQQGWPEKVADHLRPYFQRKLELTVDGECLVWGMRVVIPPSLRIKMLNCLHETHSGMNKLKAVARSHFWWPNLDTQIEFLVNKCRSCQQSQDGPNKGKWQPWKWSTRPWQRIHIDFANKENINLLIVVDSHSKWIEAIPMRETTTRKTIEQLRRLFSSYGLPEELVSDNGPQFTGSEMKGFLEGNGIKQTLIPAYHPQSNGLAERAVRTIKTALDKNKRKIGDTIQDTLSKVLLAYRSTPHVTTGKTPSELFIGRALRTRVSLIHPSLASRVRDQQARQMKYDRRTHLEEFQIDDLVWCKNFRGGDKWIPGKIVGKKGTRVYTILIHGQVKAYHRDQIRKRWRNGEEDESGDGEHQPEHSRGAGPSAIISEVVRDRGYMESLSPGLTSQRSDQDSEVQSDTDDGKSLEPLRSLDPEALKEEGPVLRRNPPRARRPPLTENNYTTWSMKMEAILDSKDLFEDVIVNDEPDFTKNKLEYDIWKKKNREAYSLIILSLSDDLTIIFRGDKRAKRIWYDIKKRFEGSLENKRIDLMLDLARLKLNPNENVNMYIVRAQKLAQEITQLGKTVTERELVRYIVEGLTPNFDTITAALSINREISLPDLRQTLLDFEKKRQDRSKNHENAFRSSGNQFKEKSCFICKRKGHFKKDCWFNPNNKGNQKNTTNKNNMASTRNYHKGPKQNKDTARSAIQERTEEPSQRRNSTSEYALHASTREERPTTQDVWIIDSACTSHMTSHGEWIEHKTEEIRSIQVAEEGRHIESASSGLIQATVQGKDKLNNAVTLHNVLHVPHLKGNLMSIPSVVRRGNSVLLNSEGAYIYSSDDKLIGTGNFDGNMYTLNLSRLSEAIHVPNEHCLISKDNSRTAWHRRLGHPSDNKLDLILKNNLLKGLDSINGTLDQCDACSLGKMTKVPYVHTDGNQESYPFEAIYVDLCGPMRINSLGGSKYFLTIVDGFSRRIFVEFLKDKLSAAEVLKKFIVKRENELNSKLKRLRTDNGTEFINKNLETFIESKVIKHELTTPYTPRSNGRVERANRTLLDKGRTLLADSQLPLHFWAEAVNTAAYLYNLTPTTNDPDTTPMEKWKGKKPSVSHIMRFGCEVFYKLENHQRHKLEAKSKRGIFVGYLRCRRAYLVFDITTRVILETADIHFRENNNVISEEKQSDDNMDTDTYFFIQEDEQLDNHVLSDVDIEEPASDTMINRQTESSGSDRPQRTRTIPKRFDDYVLATTNETIPKDYDEAIACEDKKHWENAMLEEIQNMYSHQVWELVPRPVNAKVVKSKWVFKISKDQENKTKTYKARLVAMGYNQIPGRDYNESFSPVIKNATLRTILSMAATKDSVIKLFDVKAAYLNGNIENTIFMEQPAGFVQDRNKVCKLNKSIYGLPQSGRSWYEKFSQVLHDCGLKKLKSDPCLFKWKNEDKYFYVGIYVDDFITVSDSEDTSNRFINKLRHHLEIKDVTCKGMFLGIKIIQDKEGISLQQSHYVQQILQKYGMENCKEVPTPGSKEINLDNHIEDDNCDQHTYQEALGMLMFLAVNTRPDIAYITSKLSQYSRQPKQMHWTAIKRVMRYLQGTIDLGVKFERGKTGILKSYTDASWSTTHDGKSYGGYVLKLGEATIDWKSSKQPLVALSTMEAEMIAACESCCQIKLIINLLRELEEWNFMEKPTAIYTDSQSLINWISSPKQSSRCRHINRKYHFLRDCYESRDICLLYKPSQDLEADIFTKDLSRDQMKKHLESLSIVGIKPKDVLVTTTYLTENNYTTWSMKMEAILDSKDLFEDVIVNDEPDFTNNKLEYDIWKKKNREAYSLIILSLSDDLTIIFRGDKRAKRIWYDIKKRFEGSLENKRIDLMLDLARLKLNPNENVNMYIVRAQKLAQEITQLGKTVTERELVRYIVEGLTPNFDTIAAALSINREISLPDLRQTLLDFEKKRQDRSKNPENAFRSSGNQFKEKSCFICKRKGHFKKDCWFNPDNKGNQKNTTNKNNMASTRNYHKGPKQNKDTARSAIQERMEEPSQRRDSTSEYALHVITREERPTTQDVWIIDSACTSHMTSHGDWIEHKTEERRSIQVAEEGRHIESTSSGLIQATVQGKDKLNNAVTLHNVLHVPHLKGNLMSIPSVVRRGNSVLLNSEGAYIYSSDDKLIGTGNFDGNMYTLNLSRLSEAIHVPNEHCLISKDNSRTAWHRRLGHPSNNKLDLILKNNLLKGLNSINGTLDQCDACSLGKMTKVPYVHTDGNQESYPFEAIYVDLCGPMRINSLGGSKYFLTIVDGFSRRIFVEFLKDKLSAAEVLKKFIVKRENELNSKLKRLRTDNGTEFINKNLETFIESKGIKHELTTPYTPRSNGRVERANRTLLDKGRTLLADSQLPLHFWAEAVNTAAYLYNLTPTTNDPDTTPMEKWKGKKPSVSHIMRFGCEVFYKLENHQRHKLEAKSKRGIFVGYSRCRRAYRVFDITARVILETADIHFRENNNVISEEKQNDNNTDTDTYFFIQEDEQLNNHVLSDVDIEEPAPDTMVNRQTESSESDRPQRTRTIPKRFDDYRLATTNETIPKDYEEAIACEDKKHWENAMLEEIQNMYSHQVWEFVPRPVNSKVVKSKWVFKISKDQENKTYKARLVAMGYNQIPGRDYNESFSPVIKNATIRTILSMAATKDSVIKLFDVKAAYLNGNIENTIFMEQPAGFVQDRNKVCKLNKSIYGLPQSGRSWYEKFSQVLHDCGLEKLKSDPCLFKWKNEDKYFYVGIYVDDFITVSDSEDTSNRFINKLRHHLEIKDVTCKGMFLGIKIIQDKEGISLQQSHYVQQILQKYGMENCKEVPTPGSKEINLDNHIEDDNCEQHTYQEALGMLMFLAVNTRPDIAYITSKLSQYSKQPKQMHWTAIKRVMRYLRGTIDLGVKFERGKTGILKSYADASWSTTHDGKSYGGYRHLPSVQAIPGPGGGYLHKGPIPRPDEETPGEPQHRGNKAK